MRIWTIAALALILTGCGGKGGYTPPVPPVPPVPVAIDVGSTMFSTVDYVIGTTHVNDQTLRPPNIPAEYAAFDPVYVRVTYATDGITELRSIFGIKAGKIYVLAEEKWDRPPRMMIEVQSYFLESSAGLGVIYFPVSLGVGESANFAGTAKWNWGLSLDEPRAAGTFNYTFGKGMESLIDSSQPSGAACVCATRSWLP